MQVTHVSWHMHLIGSCNLWPRKYIHTHCTITKDFITFMEHTIRTNVAKLSHKIECVLVSETTVAKETLLRWVAFASWGLAHGWPSQSSATPIPRATRRKENATLNRALPNLLLTASRRMPPCAFLVAACEWTITRGCLRSYVRRIKIRKAKGSEESPMRFLP